MSFGPAGRLVGIDGFGFGFTVGFGAGATGFGVGFTGGFGAGATGFGAGAGTFPKNESSRERAKKAAN